MGLRHRVDPGAGGVRVCTLAVVGREGRRQFERRLRRFAAPALERPAGRDLFRPPLAQPAHRRCPSRRRWRRQPPLGARGPARPVPGRARARAFHPHARHSRQPDRDARHRPPALRRGCRRVGCARERRRSARAVDEPEPVERLLARRRREARPRHADRQRPGPPRRAYGRQSTAFQPVGGVAKRADRDRRGAERSRGGGEGRVEPVRIRARFADWRNLPSTAQSRSGKSRAPKAR